MPHEHVAVRERGLGAGGEQRLEQLRRQRAEHARVGDEPLVAAAVEEERRALAVARVLHLADEQRVVAAPVRAHDACHDVREGAVDERRVAYDDEARLGTSSATRPAKRSDRRRLARLEHVDPVAHALVEQRAHLRAAVDRDEHERRVERDGHERVRGHAVYLVARARGDHGDPGREHAERAAEGDRRVALEPSPSSSSSRSGTSSERRLRRAGRRTRAGHASVIDSDCLYPPCLVSKESCFTVEATDGAARAGVIRTAHGEIPTPAFMPVGTKATVKTLHPDEVRAVGAARDPRQHVPPALPAGRGRDRGARRPARASRAGTGRSSPTPVVSRSSRSATRCWPSTTTASPSARSTTGHPERFTPEGVAEIQRRLGSDIAMCLDICPPADATARRARAGGPADARSGPSGRSTRPARRAAPLRDRPGRDGSRAAAPLDRGDHGPARSTASRSVGSPSARAAPRCSTRWPGRRRSSRSPRRATSWGSATPRGSSR